PARVNSIMALKIGGKPINGLYTEPDTREIYPRGDTLAQVLGSQNGDGQWSGVQESYDAALSGESGERRLVKDAKGQTINVQEVKRMQPGKTLRLTVSAPLQNEMEQVLAG